MRRAFGTGEAFPGLSYITLPSITGQEVRQMPIVYILWDREIVFDEQPECKINIYFS